MKNVEEALQPCQEELFFAKKFKLEFTVLYMKFFLNKLTIKKNQIGSRPQLDLDKDQSFHGQN